MKNKFILHEERNGVRQLEHLEKPRFILNVSAKDLDRLKKGESINLQNPILLEQTNNFMAMARLMREAGQFIHDEILKK